MSTLAVTHPTLMDLRTRLDPNDQIARVIELLALRNEMLEDAVFVEANDMTSHFTTVRTGLPTPTWRKLYGGVQPTKSTTAQVRDAIGTLEAYAEVDAKLVDLSGDPQGFRLTEDMAHIEGFNQEVASTLLYGNETTAPAEFTGLSPRFNDTTASNGENILKGDGAGSDNTSIWLIVWGPDSCHMIYPKGGTGGGLKYEDKGRVTAENIDGSNGRAEIYRSHYTWDCGLSVRDWRQIVRICNIDVSNLTKDAATGSDLIDLMVQAQEQVFNLNAGRPAFYVSRTVRSYLRRQITNHKNMFLTLEQVGGKQVLMFDGIPVRRTDAITAAEATVS